MMAGKRNGPKHVEFNSKNKFEKLVHLVGFIIRIYHDARSPERQAIYHDARSPERPIYHDARSPERPIYHDARSPDHQSTGCGMPASENNFDPVVY